MNFRSVVPVALLAALALPVFAQREEAPPQKEEELNLTLPTDEWYVPKNTLTFGYRMISKGVSAKFGNLGSVKRSSPPAALSDGAVTRVYDSGYVTVDTARANESLPTSVDTPADGASAVFATYPGNGRYQTYITTNLTGNIITSQTGDYMAYVAGKTREWTYTSDTQLDGNKVYQRFYSATSAGATAQAKEGATGGVELTFGHEFGKLSQRVDWSLTGGLSINSINAKAGGTVVSNLTTRTDTFIAASAVPTGQTTKSSPTFTDLTLGDGTVVTSGYENTITLGDTPVSSTTTTTNGGASVLGNWKIKGAYFLLKVGPSVRLSLNDRWGVSASIGLAGAYAGSRYSVTEEITLPDVGTPISEDVDDTKAKFLGGFYADVNVDWVATERTGLFAGVTMQHLGSYDQEVGGRTAKIDFGSTAGIRGGLSYKF